MVTINSENIAISEKMFDYRTVVEILAFHEVDDIKFRAALGFRIAGFTDNGEWFSLPNEEVEAKKTFYKTLLRNDVMKQISKHMAVA